MSPQDQKIMEETWADANIECRKGSLAGAEEGKNNILAAGKKLTSPTPEETAAWQKAAEPIFNKWQEDAKKLGIDTPISAKILAGWKEIRAKYMK